MTQHSVLLNVMLLSISNSRLGLVKSATLPVENALDLAKSSALLAQQESIYKFLVLPLLQLKSEVVTQNQPQPGVLSHFT